MLDREPGNRRTVCLIDVNRVGVELRQEVLTGLRPISYLVEVALKTYGVSGGLTPKSAARRSRVRLHLFVMLHCHYSPSPESLPVRYPSSSPVGWIALLCGYSQSCNPPLTSAAMNGLDSAGLHTLRGTCQTAVPVVKTGTLTNPKHPS